MPVIRSVYSAVKQIFETVLKEQSRAFREVILFEFPRKNCWSIGFITGPVEPSIQELTPDDTVNIFMPTTPNPTTGFLLFLPRRRSEEQPFELQSLMRNSYAVFGLQKKKQKTTVKNTHILYRLR